MAPMWDRIDPLAEKYYGISPYANCGGDPVNRGDYDGEYIYTVNPQNGNIEKSGELGDSDVIKIIGGGEKVIQHVDKPSILEGIEGSGYGTTTSVGSFPEQLMDAFFFLADNTNIEWPMIIKRQLRYIWFIIMAYYICIIVGGNLFGQRRNLNTTDQCIADGMIIKIL